MKRGWLYLIARDLCSPVDEVEEELTLRLGAPECICDRGWGPCEIHDEHDEKEGEINDR